MNAHINECSRCGAKLASGMSDESCPKCLLEIGLASGTDFSLGSLAETLPHHGMSSTSVSAELNDDHTTGLRRYHDLQAIHDWSGGTVYRAFHAGLQRPVLLRVLESSADDDARRTFLRRAEKLSHLNHAHTASTLEAGIDHGAAYVAEEWLEGFPVKGFLPRSRRDRWAEGFFPNAELIRIIRDAASGLEAIHQAGMTHDRINPDSVIFDSSGIVKLIGLVESSESADDRFAMPIETIVDEATSPSGPQDSSPSRRRKSVATDVFRLGATFCFLTTGKTPTELDKKLDATVLARRLKQLNPGLRSDLCRVIAALVAVAPIAGTTEDPNRSETTGNPYESTRQLGDARYVTAADVVDELNRLLQTDAQRFTWRARYYSGHIEALVCVLIAGFGYAAISSSYENQGIDVPVFLILSVYLLPITYVIAFETLLGWTVARRCFGMRLLDQAGERAVWWRRLWRAVQKSTLLVVLITLPAMIIPLVGRPLLFPLASLVLVPILTLFLPTIVMYVPSLWIPSRWTSYDLATGVTWGEELRVTAAHIAETTPAASCGVRLSSPTGIVDQYELFEQLGSGGMGQVFRGRDTVLGRDVAIKLLSGSLVENPLLLERFQREARLAAKVNHPGVAKVFGNGIWNGAPYIAMELVPGRNLQERVKDLGQMPLITAWDYIMQAAEALRAADRSGVVHRDVKPANLMVTDNGRLKVTDFGVSRAVGLAAEGEMQQTNDLGTTDVGTIVGTPAYMAPEQAMGKEVDRRCDIYALGMTLYHMLSGHAPFKANNATQMLAKQMSEIPASLRGKIYGLTSDQCNVIERMIAKQPADRYGTYEELIDDFRRYAPGVDRLANPIKRIAAQVTQWAAGYVAFMLIIAITFLVKLNSDLNQYDSTTLMGYLMLFLYVGVIGWLVTTAAWHGTTPGKRLVGLRIVRPDGRALGIWRASIRLLVAYPLVVIYGARIIHYVIARVSATPSERHLIQGLVVVQVGMTLSSIVMMWARADRRTLHDFAADSIVVRDKC